MGGDSSFSLVGPYFHWLGFISTYFRKVFFLLGVRVPFLHPQTSLSRYSSHKKVAREKASQHFLEAWIHLASSKETFCRYAKVHISRSFRVIPLRYIRGVMSGSFIEHTPLSSLFLRLPIILGLRFKELSWGITTSICLFLYGLGVPLLCFGFAYLKSRFFCLNFYLTLEAYRYASPSEEISKNSISS